MLLHLPTRCARPKLPAEKDVGDDGEIFVPAAGRFLGGVFRSRRGLAPDLRAHGVSRPEGSDGEYAGEERARLVLGSSLVLTF